MYFAYFDEHGILLSVSSKQCSYPESSIVMREVPKLTNANAIYLDKGTMEVCEKQNFAVTASYNRLSGLPQGTMISVEEGTFIVDDGSIEFEADVQAAKSVWLDHPHYFATRIEVETGPENR